MGPVLPRRRFTKRITPPKDLLLGEKGRGVSQDYAEAVKWCRLAAKQGDTKAQCNLGAIYDKGLGVPQDYAEAAKWYRLAAEQGDTKAQYKLPSAMREGRVAESGAVYSP